MTKPSAFERAIDSRENADAMWEHLRTSIEGETGVCTISLGIYGDHLRLSQAGNAIDVSQLQGEELIKKLADIFTRKG